MAEELIAVYVVFIKLCLRGNFLLQSNEMNYKSVSVRSIQSRKVNNLKQTFDHEDHFNSYCSLVS